MKEVLRADYQAYYRQTISQILRDSNYKVRTVKDGSEALEQIKINPPDLIIVEPIMPKLNGYAVCREVKSNPATKNIPAIVCSAMSEEFDRFWSMKQGADAYIGKPFQPQELLETVKKLLTE